MAEFRLRAAMLLTKAVAAGPAAAFGSMSARFLAAAFSPQVAELVTRLWAAAAAVAESQPTTIPTSLRASCTPTAEPVQFMAVREPFMPAKTATPLDRR